MNDKNFKYFVGIDVAKDTLAIYSTEKNTYEVISNKASAVKKHFKGKEKDTLVIMENTGGYEKESLEILIDLGYSIHRTNNNNFKHWVHFKGLKAKTDKIDAKMLALYGQENENLALFSVLHKDEEAKRIQLFKYLEDLKKTRAREKNRLKSPGFDQIRGKIEETIKHLSEVIEQIEKELQKFLKTDPEVKEKMKVLQSYPGIGKVIATGLIFWVPELGKISSRKICALCGLAPYNQDSGTIKGYRSTKGKGRKKIKQLLFLGAMCSKKNHLPIKKFFDGLIGRGKKKKVAIVACTRKILIHLNAMMREYYSSLDC